MYFNVFLVFLMIASILVKVSYHTVDNLGGTFWYLLVKYFKIYWALGSILILYKYTWYNSKWFVLKGPNNFKLSATQRLRDYVSPKIKVDEL